MEALNFYRNLCRITKEEAYRSMGEDTVAWLFGQAKADGRDFICWSHGMDLYIATEREIAIR